jgi:hypothetical protein
MNANMTHTTLAHTISKRATSGVTASNNGDADPMANEPG